MKPFSKMLKPSRICQQVGVANNKQKSQVAFNNNNNNNNNNSSKNQTVSTPPLGSVAKAEYFVYPENISNNSNIFRQPVIVGVAGGTGSGKTSVCRKIIEQLLNNNIGEHSGILSLSQDCFYRNLNPAEMNNIQNFNFDHPEAFDFVEIISALKKLKEGKCVDLPQYDFLSSTRLKEITHVKKAEIILVDGILTFYNEELRKLFDMKIFVDTDADTRLARRLRRDLVERGRDTLQVLNHYENTVKPSFETFVLPTKKFADVIIPRGAENVVAIDLVCQHLKMKIIQKNQNEKFFAAQ